MRRLRGERIRQGSRGVNGSGVQERTVFNINERSGLDRGKGETVESRVNRAVEDVEGPGAVVAAGEGGGG